MNIRARTVVRGFALAFAGALLPASAAEVSGFAERGTFQPYEISGVPLLDSFFFRYHNDEHHLQAIQIEPASPIPNPCAECADVPAGQIFLTFQDEGADDNYFYRVSHASVPEGVFRHRTSDFCKNTCSQWLNRPSRDHVFVITGFTFFFPGKDHRLTRIAIWEENGQLTVHYKDRNGDDLFRYDLEYVYLPREMIPITGHVSGVEARGEASATLDLGPVRTGPTVLRGFDLVFLPDLDFGMDYDQEVREIGIRTPENRIEVFFSNNDRDRFDWGVDWGALSRLPVVFPDPPRVR